MVLTALLNDFHEPLDLWLSSNHSGRRLHLDARRRSEAQQFAPHSAPGWAAGACVVAGRLRTQGAAA